MVTGALLHSDTKFGYYVVLVVQTQTHTHTHSRIADWCLILQISINFLTDNLKPMDSFGTWRKWKLIYVYIYLFVNAEFYTVVWTIINALLTIRYEMLPFSRNNQNIQNVRSPPEHFAIGYVYIMIICRWAILHYNMSFKTIVGRSAGVFW